VINLKFKKQLKFNVFSKVSLWWRHDGRYYPEYLIQGFKNIIYWLPVIWKDRNWDSYYIFEILQHKLSAQAKYIGDRNIHTGAQQDARRMKLCISLIEKVQDETYSMEYLNYTDQDFFFKDIKSKPGCSELIIKENSQNYQDYFDKYPLIYKRVMNGEGIFKREGREDDLTVIAMNISHINHDRARKLLFKIMEENIEGWWD